MLPKEEYMRKYVALALTALIAVVAASFAFAQAGDPQQKITAKISPTKLDKKKYKNAKLLVKIDTKGNDEATTPTTQNEPPKATNTKVDFPTNLKFNTKAVPFCKVNSGALEGTTTDQAIDLCGKKSIISTKKGTKGEVGVGTPTGMLEFPVVITAFNGTKKNTLILHARQDQTQNTSILTGKLKKGPKGYGKRLDVDVPPLAAGGISKFYVNVDAGKYVQARCKSKKNKFQASSVYTNHSPTKNVYTTKCKRK
jgi:hypothetical protein